MNDLYRRSDEARFIIEQVKNGCDNCFYCGTKLNYSKKTVDHKIPVSRGGKTGFENLVVSCKSCNTDKGCKTVEEFWQYKNYKNYIRTLGMEEAIILFENFVSVLKEFGSEAQDEEGFLVRWKCQAIRKVYKIN